jgi:hypothetical protein
MRWVSFADRHGAQERDDITLQTGDIITVTKG